MCTYQSKFYLNQGPLVHFSDYCSATQVKQEGWSSHLVLTSLLGSLCPSSYLPLRPAEPGGPGGPGGPGSPTTPRMQNKNMNRYCRIQLWLHFSIIPSPVILSLASVMKNLLVSSNHPSKRALSKRKIASHWALGWARQIPQLWWLG